MIFVMVLLMEDNSAEPRWSRIEHVFQQRYHNWPTQASDHMDMRSATFDILEKLDSLETDVYSDPEYTVANKMLDQISWTNKKS